MKPRRIKNNTKIKLSLAGGYKGAKEEIFAFFKNKETGEKVGIYLGCDRGNNTGFNMYDALLYY